MKWSILFALVILLLTAKLTRAVEVLLQATTSISVCGNLSKEDGEDCDNLDLGSATCRSLGYDTGDLSCDIGCDYDTSLCSGVAPTPTPTPQPSVTPSPSPSPMPTATPQGTAEPMTTATPTPSPTPLTIVTPIEVIPVVQKPFLPTPLVFFDPNGDGKLQISEVREIVGTWVSALQTTLAQLQFAPLEDREIAAGSSCDINTDKRCNLRDFSVLMYYLN